ncbi:MAG: nucleotidyltransferase family protein [Candidatus Sericytochromatia bacterium]
MSAHDSFATAELPPLPHLEALGHWLEYAGPPEAWLAAGCVVQGVWNALTGRPADHGILDYDVVYWEADLSATLEAAWRNQLQRAFPKLDLDVKNQARVHCWYPERFGRHIDPLPDVESALRTWPTTATATAVRWRQGQWEVLAPFGLTDLLSLTVRPNRAVATEAVYLAKTERWRALWPELTLLPWSAGIGAP